MSMLITLNREAQERVMDGLNTVLATHSEQSRQSLMRSLQGLHQREDLDVVIISHHVKFGQDEFGLAWFKKSANGNHPANNPQETFMIGALVYDPDSDSWSVNT